MIRLALVPVFVWLLVWREDPVAAGWLLAGIGATDWVDGYLARRLGQVSKVGEFLDPLADRAAVAAALVGGLVTGDLPTWYAVALIVREIGVAAGALYLGLRARAKLEVRYIGKMATFGVYAALAWFLIGRGGDVTWLEVAAWVAGIPALVLYYVVAVQYFIDFRRTLAAERGGE